MARDSTAPETTTESTEASAPLPDWMHQFDDPALEKHRNRVLGSSRTLFGMYPGPVILFTAAIVLGACILFVSTLWPLTTGGRG